ncbi:hypothetical protein CRUP_037964 [Coryphaenoides rupestris]|nr:hypothetical protein CRUP_037964 [Coryphaenoides rupestris]
MLARVSEFLWWERLWLPGNVSWSDLRDHDGRVYAKPSHLYAVLPCAFVLLFVRYLFESGSRFPTQVEVRSLCKKTSWSERRVQIWFRRRRNQARAGLRKRFCEARDMLARVSEFLWWERLWLPGNVSWSDLRDHDGWVYAKPSHLYAVLPCAFVLLFVRYLFESLTFDVKRKDFKEQVIHHIATLTLLAFSWASNYIRIGTLVMATHDSADILLEGAKILNYAKWQRSANGVFVVFTLLFALTRMLYPAFFGYYFFNAMLVVLQFLHFYWAVLISKMLYKCLFSKLEGDDRSDEDEEEDSDPPKEGNPRLSYTKGSRARGRANGH